MEDVTRKRLVILSALCLCGCGAPENTAAPGDGEADFLKGQAGWNDYFSGVTAGDYTCMAARSKTPYLTPG